MKTRRVCKKYHITAFVLLFLIAGLEDAKAQLILGARSTAMGQASTALAGDTWNVFANPAMLPTENGSVSFYGIRYYGFSELTDMAIAGHYSLDIGTVAVGMHTFGYDLYRESRFRTAFKYDYQGLKAGAVVNFTHIAIEDYGSAGALTFDLGLTYRVIDGLHFGVRAANISRSSLGEAREELPRELAAGASYQLNDRATLSSDIVKDVRFPLSYRAGLEVRVYDQLFVRGGITTEPLTYSAGLGFTSSSWGVNIVAQQHYVLGWNPGFDLNINF